MSLPINDILECWAEEAGFVNHPPIPSYKIRENELILKTQNPDLFLGFRGILNKKYQEVLKSNGYPYRIKLVQDKHCQ